MGISKRYLDWNATPLYFDPAVLGGALEEALPEVVFCYLLGSAAQGTIAPHSDLDLAVYVRSKGQAPAPPADVDSYEVYHRAADVVQDVVGDVRCDLGFLNGAEPVYRFEALKGRLLFCRDQEQWSRFYSVTCREYEHQLFRYERQRRYRLEAAGCLSSVSRGD